MGNEIDAGVADVIECLLDRTARTLGESFSRYWPGDDLNDPVERNVSLHFAHAMLSLGFASFAEGNHPDRTTGPKKVDIFGIEPSGGWFLACEFKKLTSAAVVLHDIARLRSFWLRNEFPLSVWGEMYSTTLTGCQRGYGLVGGLHWVAVNRTPSPLCDAWSNHATLQQIGATISEPRRVVGFPKGNQYFLLSAYFSIDRPCDS